MAKFLVIVESPAKAKTIKKYLGKDYAVEASMGHLRDLPKSQFGVDIDNNFEPRYITIRGKGELLSKLKKQAKVAEKVLLATDPDREGEAISWHLACVLGIDCETNCRIAFNEVTKSSIKSAVKEPRSIDINLVNAQQARRVLDRLVGYKISPLLWRKVKKGLSAGRVQSVATRLVVDRENEREAFESREYWSITANLIAGDEKIPFAADFQGDADGKIELPNGDVVASIEAVLKKADYVVNSIKKSERKRSPAPPFTTSTLQQEAFRKLSFRAFRTMRVAQQLYEGVEIENQGAVGLITYMRTDSLRISNEAASAAKDYILENYGANFYPAKCRVYKSKKDSQDAHEAIRPTTVAYKPDQIKNSLTPEQYKLYKLIWSRFVASQMADAVFDTVKVIVSADKYFLSASGSAVKFQGFMKVYTESEDSRSAEKNTLLPPLENGQKLELKTIKSEQHFTQPPPSYTEATLIKTMEENGVGRPSTYAPTVSTITSRGYVTRESKNLLPTQLGRLVVDLMKEYFGNIADVDFTADLEGKLDEVEEGRQRWRDIIRDFYDPFEKLLTKAEESIGKLEIKDEYSSIPCEKCGRMMVYKQSRYGVFLACPGYPECKYTKAIVEEVGIDCPKCKGKILVKKSRKGVKYYACENSRICGFMSWDEPLKEKCPKCGSLLLKKKPFRGKGASKVGCYNIDCDYERKDLPAENKTEAVDLQSM